MSSKPSAHGGDSDADRPLQLVVLASGTGSNLAALLRSIGAGRCHAQVRAVVTDRRKAGALKLAADHGIEAQVVHPKDHADRPAWDVALAEKVAEFEPDVVICAGFMRIVGAPILERFPGRIVNVHPALLPAFKGKDGAAQAVAAGARISGCTVHVVDSGVDTGPTLAQAAVPVLPDDDAAALQARIQRVEHQLLPRIIHAIATGRILLGSTPRLDMDLNAGETSLFWPPIAAMD